MYLTLVEQHYACNYMYTHIPCKVANVEQMAYIVVVHLSRDMDFIIYITSQAKLNKLVVHMHLSCRKV